MESTGPIAGVLTLTGHGLRVTVERGHLSVDDGVGTERRRARFARAASGIRRVVVLGHSGIVSLSALRWLHDIGAAFVQIDHDGNLIMAGGVPGLDDARLRRAQSLALQNGTALRISRKLVKEKI